MQHEISAESLMSEQLALERKNLSFDIERLGEYYYGGKEQYAEMKRLYKALAEDPILRHDPNYTGLSRADRMVESYKRTARLHQIVNIIDGETNSKVLSLLPDIPNANLHGIMFVPTLINLGAKAQIEKFLPDSLSLRILGCYAQTEIGHGSDIQSLETTATYDPETEEFVLHSPTITSIKFWPGELGLTANYAAVYAKLIVKGECHGVQVFIVPIRDLDTHKVLPGLEVGDIGAKFGYATKDNGFLRFHHYRIPRENMLSKYASVSKTGEFKQKGNPKIAYATMMKVRLFLVCYSSYGLGLAATIATRYSIVRKQFRGSDGKERPILDYELQMNKVISQIATSYAMSVAGRKVKNMFMTMMDNIQTKNDFSLMMDLHGLLSGCKACFTWDTLSGMEILRQSCGGHGYLESSGFTNLIQHAAAKVTLEGDNTVMLLQMGRYLIKSLQRATQGKKIDDNVAYLEHAHELMQEQCPAKSKDDFDNLELVLRVMQVSAASMLISTTNEMLKYAEAGIPPKEIFDVKTGLLIFDASKAHTYCFTFKSFMESLKEADEETRKVLKKLCLLYGINKLLENAIGLAECGYFAKEHFAMLKAKKSDLLASLRPDAIGLVDAMAFEDSGLKSALGRYDGNVYETLYEWASKANPLNKEDPNPGFMKYMKPIMGKNVYTPKL